MTNQGTGKKRLIAFGIALLAAGTAAVISGMRKKPVDSDVLDGEWSELDAFEETDEDTPVE